MNTAENDNLPEPNLDDLANFAEAEALAGAKAEATDPATDSNDVLRLIAERDDLRNRLARVQADFTNARKRLEADFANRLAYANEKLITALLPVIDDWERALAVDSTKVDSATILKGLEVVHDKMIAVLKQQQVEPVSPAEGDLFDPNQHLAVTQRPDERFPGEPHVLQTFQKGYTLAGRALRPASVMVSQANG